MKLSARLLLPHPASHQQVVHARERPRLSSKYKTSDAAHQALGRNSVNLFQNWTADRLLLADSVENSRPWFPWQKSTRLRLKSFRRAEVSGLRFRGAARKKGVFSNQFAGSLEGPTFSTESAVADLRDRLKSARSSRSRKASSSTPPPRVQITARRRIGYGRYRAGPTLCHTARIATCRCR
jgi:hypothetical protein